MLFISARKDGSLRLRAFIFKCWIRSVIAPVCGLVDSAVGAAAGFFASSAEALAVYNMMKAAVISFGS